MAGEPIFNALKTMATKFAQPQTRSFGVTPEYADSYPDILRKAYVDARYQTNSLNNEAAVALDHPNLLNGQRWSYRKVYQGPFTPDDGKGHVALDGRDTLHFHLSDPRDGIGEASDTDLGKLQGRLRQMGEEDSTMAVADRYGNIHAYGSRDSLARRGFRDEDMVRVYRKKLDNDDPVSKFKDGDNPEMDVPMYGVILPGQRRR